MILVEGTDDFPTKWFFKQLQNDQVFIFGRGIRHFLEEVAIIDENGSMGEKDTENVLMYNIDAPLDKGYFMVGIFLEKTKVIRDFLADVCKFDKIDELMGINIEPLDEFTTFKYEYITKVTDTKDDLKKIIHNAIRNIGRNYGN